MANIFDEIETTPASPGNLFDEPESGNIFDEVETDSRPPSSGSGAAPKSISQLPSTGKSPETAPVLSEKKDSNFQGLIPLAENPINLEKTLQINEEQRKQYEEKVYREIQKVDSEELWKKVKSGQPLTDVEQAAQLYQTGQTIPTNLFLNIAIAGAGLAAPIATVGAGTLGKVAGTALGEGLVGAGTNIAYDVAESATKGKLPDAKQTGLNALYGFIFGAAGGAAGAAFRGKDKAVQEAVEGIARKTGRTADDVADDIISQATRENKPAPQVISEQLGDGAKEFNKLWERNVRESYQPTNKYAGSINLERQKLSGPGLYELEEAGETVGKGPKRTHQQVTLEARTNEMGPNDFLQVENPMSMTDVEKKRLRDVVGAEAERIGRLRDDPNIPQDVLDQQKLDFLDLVAKDAYVASETGRTLAQRAIDVNPVDDLAEARIKALAKIRNSDNAADKQWLIKQTDMLLGAGDVNTIREIMYNALTSPVKKVTDALETAIINGYLSSPTTWVKVHVSQGIYTLERPLAERPLAAGFDAILSAARGTKRTRYLKDSLYDLQGITDAMPEAAYYFIESAKAQRQIFTEDVLGKPFLRRADFGEAFGFIPGGRKAGKVLGKAIQVPGGTMVGAGDDAVKVLNYRAVLNVEANRIARQAGLKGDAYATKVAELVSKPTKEMLAKAASESFEKAMQRPLSKPALAVQNLRDSLPVGGRIINPFITVADSTIRSAYERSPFFIASLIKNRRTLTQGELSDALARMTIGTIVAGGAYTLAEKGFLTGGTPMNGKDRQAWYATGRKPYSLITPGGKVIPYSALEPASTLMGAMADYHGLTQYADNEDAAWKIGWYVFARNILNKSYMDGLANFLGAVQDPGKAESAFEKQAAGALTPQIAYRITGVMDPTLRDPQNLTQAFQKRIPGQSENVPPIRDIWGQPVMDMGNPISKMVNPFRMSELEKDPATNAVFESRARIISPSESIGKIPMTLDEYEMFVEMKGKVSHGVISDYVNSKLYQQDTPELRKLQIEAIDREVNRDAREWIEDVVYERVRREGYSDEEYEDMRKGYMDVPEEMKQ